MLRYRQKYKAKTNLDFLPTWQTMDMFAMALDKAGKDDPIKVAPLSHPLDCFSRCDRGMLPELMNALHVPAPNPWRVTKLPAARSW